jgi:hypothetical protein
VIPPCRKGRKLLESLTYSYLDEWITRQKDSVKRGEEGAKDRLAAALELQKRLEATFEGEPPVDIFVRRFAYHQIERFGNDETTKPPNHQYR